MTDELEEKRPFSYIHMKSLMMLAATYAAILAAEASHAQFDNIDEMKAYPAKKRKELDDKVSSLLNEAWEKAK